METNTNVTFKWENHTLIGIIEREYENSFLIQVNEPSKEIMEKFNGRMVISKKQCKTLTESI
ncbi:DUF2187 domain-containing protein [Enterococcus saccharolyticus]|uniref:DUF2187 domain-containing protein n=1 Tax=Candidatus Enterococcus willemsii TaxID=1857215 RepID=A0ABQ6Z1E4_9ENTE|nr:MULTISPECIES: DUF2187 domain-containing protein [Enterococcus]KAF1305262.1 DUF2187 domain-containing protein [Enterococcus sp. CU12B]MCD5002482.1 DUF2187 domain-containing protein [Enterococcus saccharolyticus]